MTEDIKAHRQIMAENWKFQNSMMAYTIMVMFVKLLTGIYCTILFLKIYFLDMNTMSINAISNFAALYGALAIPHLFFERALYTIYERITKSKVDWKTFKEYYIMSIECNNELGLVFGMCLMYCPFFNFFTGLVILQNIILLVPARIYYWVKFKHIVWLGHVYPQFHQIPDNKRLEENRRKYHGL